MRDLTTNMQFAIVQGVVRPVLFYEGVFTTGTLRMWSGLGTLTWNGQQWTGGGPLIGVSKVKDTDDITARGITLSMGGVSTADLSRALGSCRYGLEGRLWLGALDANNAVWANPYLVFMGLLDVPSFEDAGETCVISITYENRLADLRRPRSWRYTHEDQQLIAPGDRGLEYVPQLQDKSLVWGPQ